ncbi:MAG TPA: DUF1177 domain-containing protein [Sulfolobales archaeon]|nr:DUF1177 domain-containing protein [Sulfolobales archaeon]
MSLASSIIRVIDILDSPSINEEDIEGLVKQCKNSSIEFERLKSEKGETLFTKIVFDFGRGRRIGVIGRLGGVGARPHVIGMVSDADGAIVALAVAEKLARMCSKGENLVGKYVITTHISPQAPVKPEKPVPMMDSPIDLDTMLSKEVDREAEAILSIDATKGNRVIKVRGFAITPVVRRGWILRPSDDVLDIYIWVAGRLPVLVPITMQDIVPYSTPVKHINSIVQPWLYTDSPVMGVAITSESVIPGSASGVTDLVSLEQASRFVLEVAKRFTPGSIEIYYEQEYKILTEIHGDLGSIMRTRKHA